VRSRLALAGAALALACGGCDAVFGVAVDSKPCDDGSFAHAKPAELVAADSFSVSWDEDQIVYSVDGLVYQRALPDGTPVKIDVSIYPPAALALAPEGDALFLTAEEEPPLLQAATHDATWTVDPIVPAGTTAGTPSAAEFGPRRVLVRQHAMDPDVQEYEADGAAWHPVGDPHPVAGERAPNLTPSGLDMVYADDTGVFVAHRATTDAWFGAAVQILPGRHAFPQLLGHCRALYAADAGMVRRYDR
jgi:hypothetical protein